MKLTIHSGHYSDWRSLIIVSRFECSSSPHGDFFFSTNPLRIEMHSTRWWRQNVHFRFNKRKSCRCREKCCKSSSSDPIVLVILLSLFLRFADGLATLRENKKLFRFVQFSFDPMKFASDEVEQEKERKVVGITVLVPFGLLVPHWHTFCIIASDSFLSFIATISFMFCASHSMVHYLCLSLCLCNSSLCSIDGYYENKFRFVYIAVVFVANSLGSQLEFPFNSCGFLGANSRFFCLSHWGFFAQRDKK